MGSYGHSYGHSPGLAPGTWYLIGWSDIPKTLHAPG